MASDFDSHQYDAAYPDGVEHHYWHVRRNLLVQRLLGSPRRAGRVLEVGCGRGVVVQHLRELGYDCWGCDLAAAPPLSSAVEGYLHLATDARSLDESFAREVDVLMFLDVLEHLENPSEFVRCCCKSFGNARRLLVTLPARQEIWSNYDDFYGHQARYTTASARSMLVDAGAEVQDLGYYFHLLYPPAVVLSAVGAKRALEVKAPASVASRAAHRLVAGAMALGSHLVPTWIPGTSLYAAAIAPRLG